MSSPAAIQTGVAVLWGLTGLTTTPSGNNSLLSGSATAATFYASYIPQTSKLQHKFNIAEVKDDTGNDANLTAVNEYAEVTVDLKASAATKTLINGASGPVLLQPLSAVVLAFANYATLSGTWIYWSDASVDLKNTESGMVSLKLRRYANATQNTSLTTTISS